MRGSGLAIISHKSIQHTSISIPVYSKFECILVLLFHYPPTRLKFLQFIDPSSSISAFCAEFESLLEHHITSNEDLIFFGDYYIHIDKQDDLNTVVFNRL